MRLFNQSNFRTILALHANAQAGLEEWYTQIKSAQWSSHDDVQRSSSFRPSAVGNDRIVFRIGGNGYRLIVRVDFPRKSIFLHWFGTHAEYDRIDAVTVAQNV